MNLRRPLAIASVVCILTATAEAQVHRATGNPLPRGNNPLAQSVGVGTGYNNPLAQSVGVGTGFNNPLAQANGFGTGFNNPLAQANGFGTGFNNPLAQANGWGNGFNNPLMQANGFGNGFNNPLNQASMYGGNGNPLIPSGLNPTGTGGFSGVGNRSNAAASAALNGMSAPTHRKATKPGRKTTARRR